MDVLKVHIDPGHYGSKYNRSTTDKTYYESNMTWKLSNYLKEELEKLGAEVSLSRDTIDENPSLYNRGYGAKGSELFISIHSNASSTESTDYPVVYRGFDKEEAEDLALRISQAIQNLMNTKQVGRVATRKSTSSNDEYYGVLRGARKAGLVYYYIIEHSFHTNKLATQWLLNDDNLHLLAKKEAQVIFDYFNYSLKEDNVQNVQATNYPTQQLVWNKLIAAIPNPYAVAGLMGNIEAESNFKPNNLQNSFNKKFNMTDEEYTAAVDAGKHNYIDSAGHGLCQWTYKTRKQNLLNFARQQNKSIGDLDMQLDFLIKEIKGYKTVYKTLLNTSSVKEASDIILTGYEKPADQSDKVKDKRASMSNKWFDMFNLIVKPQSPTNVSSEVPFKVKVKAPSLNIRKGPSTDTKKVGVIIDHGVYTIIETNPACTWGLLKSKAGWISIRPNYVDRL